MDRDYNDNQRLELPELPGLPIPRFSGDMPPPVPPKDDAVSVTSTWYRTGVPAAPTVSTSRQSFISMTSSLQKPIKYGTGKNARVELVPQPSDDPADPLNWPQWRKELNFISLLLIVGLINGMKTVFVTVDLSILRSFDVRFPSIAALTAVPLMVSAFTGHASLIASKLWGKRPVYLVSFVFIFVGSIWSMTTGRNFSASMAARVFQGMGWGAFDTLVLGSIHDTFFEHERPLHVSIYHMFVVATTWGSPLLGGLATRNAGSFTVQFRIINTFYILAVPLLALGVPETAFDRPSSSASSTPPVSPMEQPEKAPAWPPTWLTKEKTIAYLHKMKPLQYKGDLTLLTTLQGPRALITPTVGLIFLLSFIPYSTIWSIAIAVPLLLSGQPMNLSPAILGTILTGPWIISTVIVASFSAYRPYHNKFGPRINAIVIAVGAILFSVGLLAFGLHVHDILARGPILARLELDPAVVSLLVGIAAGGLYMIDATTHPLIARSASFTCSTMTVAQRSIADMHAGAVVLRNFTAAIFILTIPTAISTLGGLESSVIGLSVVELAIATGTAAAWWIFDEAIRRADGKVMGLVDLSLFKDVEDTS